MSAAGLDMYLILMRTGATVPTIIAAPYGDARHEMMLSARTITDGILKKPFDPEEILARFESRDARI